MGKTLTDPLRGLAQAARRMADGDLAARAPDGRRDEIGGLARQFNSMAASLESSFRDLRAERDSLRRFVADASHELRTPITALSTFNELLQGSAAADPAAREEFLLESAAQLKRLEWITANLLDLSRLDAGIASLTMGEHSAQDILLEAAAGVRILAAEKGVLLEVRAGGAPLGLSCDRDRMVLAVSNLLSNAVKFTPPGGSVSAEAAVEQGPGAAPSSFACATPAPASTPPTSRGSSRGSSAAGTPARRPRAGQVLPRASAWALPSCRAWPARTAGR